MPTIRYESSDSSHDILVEVDEGLVSGGEVIVTNSSGEITSSKAKLESALGVVNEVADQIISRVKEINVKPSEFEVTLGIKFTAEAGVVIAKTKTEGNLEIKFKWAKDI